MAGLELLDLRKLDEDGATLLLGAAEGRSETFGRNLVMRWQFHVVAHGQHSDETSAGKATAWLQLTAGYVQ